MLIDKFKKAQYYRLTSSNIKYIFFLNLDLINLYFQRADIFIEFIYLCQSKKTREACSIFHKMKIVHKENLMFENLHNFY